MAALRQTATAGVQELLNTAPDATAKASTSGYA